MTANIMDNEKCVTVGIPAWHSLGFNSQEDMTAEAAHEAMGGSFELEGLSVGVWMDDQFQTIPGKIAIVRGPTNKDNRKIVFDFVSDNYKIVQPIDIIKTFDQKVGVSISSMGLLGEGNKLFLTWSIPSFEVVKDDEIKMFGSVLMGFDALFSSRLTVGTVRVVCANTWMAAIEEAEEETKKKRGRGVIFSGKHTNPKMLYELGEWLEFVQINAVKQSELVKNLFTKFAQTPIVHEKQAEDLIYTTWPNPSPMPESYPENLKDKKQESIDKETERVIKIRDGVYDTYMNNGIEVTEDYYGLFNSGTQFFNHVYPSKKDSTFSICWGNRANEMNQFAEILRKDIESKGV